MIVSYPYWQRYLGAQMDLSKFHLSMEGRVYQVVGVMPAGFQLRDRNLTPTLVR